MDLWKTLLFVAIGIIIILYVLNKKIIRYIKRVNRNSVVIDTRVIKQLNEVVRSIVLVHRPVDNFRFISNYYASHVAIVCITDKCNVLLSVGEFGDLYAKEATKYDSQWNVLGYGGPLMEISKYPVNGEVTLMNIIEPFIESRNTEFRLFSNNCHHMTCSIIKKFCEYDAHDNALYCPCGWSAFMSCLFNGNRPDA